MTKPSHLRFFFGLASCLFVVGCATHPTHPLALRGQKLRIAVLPVQNAVHITHLRSIETWTNAQPKAAVEKQLIDQHMSNAEKEITSTIRKGLTNSYFFEAVSARDIDRVGSALAKKNTAAQIKKTGKRLNADLVLTTQIVGYGKIKKKWLVLLIGSGVIEGATQGIIVAKAVDSPWIGLAVATEEILQESLTWGGGAYFFNKYFTPVILETELWNTADGKIIWRHNSFAKINRDALKKYAAKDRTRIDVRLRATSEIAAQEMLKALNKKALHHVRWPN